MVLGSMMVAVSSAKNNDDIIELLMIVEEIIKQCPHRSGKCKKSKKYQTDFG